jgi:hypothetical protein
MSEVRYFEPWIGGRYTYSRLKVLVLGESRYDQEYTDNQIIQDRIDGSRDRTFTKFVQAAVGRRHWQEGYDDARYWHNVIFYNYNTTVFPGGPRIPLPWERRIDGQNARLLCAVLAEFKPTHAIAWGVANWDSLAVEGSEWSAEGRIPGAVGEPYCSVVVNDHKTLFARTHHPSWQGFSFQRWASMIRVFLEMK